MSDGMGPLDPELRALLALERQRPPPEGIDTDALLRSVQSGIDAASRASAPPWWSSVPAKLGLAASFAVGALSGALGTMALRSPARVTVERVVQVPVERVVERVVQTPVERVVERVVQVPVPVQRAVARPAAPPPGAELALIDQANAALARGRHEAALASLRDHLRRFPDGALVEERERLWIDALLRGGQRAEASARAERFVRRYPESVHRARVAAAMHGGDAP